MPLFTVRIREKIMAQFPAFPLWTDAYLGDTTHLTTIEHGAYLLLLIVAWRSKDGYLPDDDKLLARYAKLKNGQWKKIRPILEPFFTIKNGVWKQGRLLDELEAVRQLSKNQSRKAKARWLKNNDSDKAAASPRQCRGNAYHIHPHIQDIDNPDFKKNNFDIDFYLDDDDKNMENVCAPGWDKDLLRKNFNAWIKKPAQKVPANPAKAYLKWLEKVKKGKPP